jgi:P-type Ca2+ transporter type 2C
LLSYAFIATHAVQIAADARLLALKTTTFKTDEASLTGESAAVSKSTDAVPADSSISSKTNTVFSGTMVTGGAAWAVVTATGASLCRILYKFLVCLE